MKNKAVCNIFIAFVCLASFCYAQTNETVELDEIKVVSAAGYEQNIADAPASIFVITKEDLEKRSEQDLTDVLKNVPGVYIESGSVFKDVSIRGMSSSYTLYLVDGKPVSGNEAHSPNGMAGGIATNSLPPVSAIERIEVVRGPMSSIYGSEAMGGVINIITKKVPNVWSGTVGAEYTKSFNNVSKDGYQTNFYLSGPVINDILSLQTYGSFLGLDESKAKGGGKSSSSNPDFKRRQAGAKLVLALNENNDLYLGYDYSKQQRVATPGKSIASSSIMSDNLAIRDSWSLGHNAKYSEFVLDSYAQYMSTYNNRKRGNDTGIFYDVLTLNSQATYFFSQNTLSLGAQYKNEELEDKVTNSLGGNIPVTMKKWQFALFVEDEWNIFDNFALTAGVRYNKDEKFGNYVNPRLYAVLNLTDKLVLKGGISTGYKSPSLRQSADDFGGVTGGGVSKGVMVGNPDLEPEKSLNYEIGTSYNNKDIGLNTGFTMFYSEFKDKIAEFRNCQGASGSLGCNYNGEAFDFISIYKNVDEAELYGAELSLKYNILSNLILSGSYTYQKSNQKTGDYKGLPLNDTPKTLASLGLEYEANSKFSVWSQANYRGKADFYGSLRSNNTQTNKAYTLVDLGANYILTDSLKVSAGIYNMFNKEITAASFGKHIDGRRVTIGFNAKF
ncbi:MAG: TonB-dependent receptor [Campylobacteraceae bacterium]|jgi:outer membrane receptor for ferrienterochelin and colicins|nr:TonB-dependent receptor [Campylobacteraceae bacterium]